tara:strand:+ start:449 stop:775 length:327 start_codon:yes stop_codon:yes gene_type:complete
LSSAETRGFSSFRYRDFTLLIVAKLFGWIAMNMILMVIAYQIYDQTGDVMNLAYIGLATFAPAIGLSLITGYVADQFDRRLVIVVCYGIVGLSALLFLVFTITQTNLV